VAGTCEVCGKHPSFGNSVSRLGTNAVHRLVRGRAKRRFSPNIQTVRAYVNGGTKKMNVCTSCIKAGKVQRRAAV